MSNKVKAMSHSIIDVGGKVGLGGVDATKVLLQLFGKLVVVLLLV